MGERGGEGMKAGTIIPQPYFYVCLASRRNRSSQQLAAARKTNESITYSFVKGGSHRFHAGKRINGAVHYGCMQGNLLFGRE